jgi:hypothetical protein
MWPFRSRRRNPRAAYPLAKVVTEVLLRDNLAEFERDYSKLTDKSRSTGWSFEAYHREVVTYILHCLDICILKEFGDDYRKAFMDSAVEFASTDLSRNVPSEARDASFADLYRSRQRMYSLCVLPAPKKPLKGTLFWEYGKHICSGVGVVNPVEITICASKGNAWFDMLASVAKDL